MGAGFILFNQKHHKGNIQTSGVQTRALPQ